MSNKPANNIMTAEEIEVLAKEQRQSRLYSKDTDASEKISTMVGILSEELVKLPEKISLGDTETVRVVASRYVDACSHSGTIPSKIGLCRALGISRQAVDNYMTRNPNHPTSELLGIIFDSFSEVLNNAALSGSCQPIVSIFVSKALYGWRDTYTIENVPPADPEPSLTPEQIAEKYENLMMD